MYEIVIMIIHNKIMLCSRMVTSSYIVRVVFGPARHEGVLRPSKELVVPCRHDTTRQGTPIWLPEGG
jgi:hypothetical protein